MKHQEYLIIIPRQSLVTLPEYKQWRIDVLTRDQFECQHCQTEEDLCVHHIIEVERITTDYNIKTLKKVKRCRALWDLNNGQTLCRSCHTKLHAKKETLYTNLVSCQ